MAKTTVGLPAEVHRALRVKAALEKRTMNEIVLAALTSHLHHFRPQPEMLQVETCAGYLAHPRTRRAMPSRSGSRAIVVMETAHDRQGDDGPSSLVWICRCRRCTWYRLINLMMRQHMIDVVHRRPEDLSQMSGEHDELLAHERIVRTYLRVASNEIDCETTDEGGEPALFRHH